MDAQQAGRVRQEGVHRGGQGGDRGEVAEDAQGGRRLQGVREGRRGQGRGQGPGRRGKDGQAKDIEAATEAPPDQSKAVAEAGHPDGAGAAGPGPAGPGRGRGAQAGAGRAAQPRRRHARGQPGDGAGRGQRAAARAVERAGVPAGAGRQAGRRRARRDRARRSSAQQETAGHRAGQGRGRARRPPTGVAGMQGSQGRGAGDAGRGQGQDQVEGRGEARRGHHEDPGDLRRDRGGREEDPRRARPEGRRRRSTEGEAGARQAFETYVDAQDVGLQEGPLRRLARRAALGQGQAARDARQGQRVLRGRPRALPQADGRGDLPGRRHRRAPT